MTRSWQVSTAIVYCQGLSSIDNKSTINTAETNGVSYAHNMNTKSYNVIHTLSSNEWWWLFRHWRLFLLQCGDDRLSHKQYRTYILLLAWNVIEPIVTTACVNMNQTLVHGDTYCKQSRYVLNQSSTVGLWETIFQPHLHPWTHSLWFIVVNITSCVTNPFKRPLFECTFNASQR